MENILFILSSWNEFLQIYLNLREYCKYDAFSSADIV
jgi:hypothetical protein